MPHGFPDWAAGRAQDLFTATLDVGELASRLGSPYNFYRGGNVLICTDFRYGCRPLHIYSEPEGGEWYLSSRGFNTGGVALRLEHPEGTTQRLVVGAVYPLSQPSVIGFAVPFTIDGNMGTFAVGVGWTYGGQYLEGALRLNWPERRVEVEVGADTWDVLDTFTHLEPGPPGFHALKVIVDFRSRRYVMGYFDWNSYNLRNYSIISAPSEADWGLYGIIDSRNLPGQHTSIWVGGAILTEE
jgi:hypothetical protein